MKRVIPRNLLEKVANKSLTKQIISTNEIEYLKPYFYDDICNLEKLIGKDLSSWK